MQLYHSKKPTIHYLLPEDYCFPTGDFEIFSTKGKKILVDKNNVTTYKISNTEAMKLLTSELNNQIGDLMKGIKNVASKISENKDTSSKSEEESSNSTNGISEKISGGIEFITLSTQVMKVFWKIAKTDNETELNALKKEMISLKEKFQEKGYEPSHDFEEVPFKLKTKYEKEGKLKDFKESANEFEAILKNFKKKET